MRTGDEVSGGADAVGGAWLGVGRGERHIGVAPAERSAGVDAVGGVWLGVVEAHGRYKSRSRC